MGTGFAGVSDGIRYRTGASGSYATCDDGGEGAVRPS